MTGLLEAARRLAAGRPDDGDLDRIRDAVAYFQRSVTRHFLDEEGSVFPRLSTRRPELAAELASLSAEHPAQIEMQAAVAAAAKELDGEARPSAGKTLLDAATKLAEMHSEHVGREDAIFKIAQEALTAEDDAEIVAEMGTRRDRDDNGGGGGGLRGGGGRGRGGGGGGGGGGGRGRGRGQEDAAQTEMLLENVEPPQEYAGPSIVADEPAAKRVTNGVSKKAAKKPAKAKTKPKAAAKTATKKQPAAKKAAAKPAAKKSAAKKPAGKPSAKSSAKKKPAKRR